MRAIDPVGYTVDTLMFGWLDNPVDIDESLQVSQFTLDDYTQDDCTQNYTAGVRYIAREAKPRRNAYWSRPSVCLSVSLSLAAFPHYCTDPDVNWENGSGCPLVVHY